MNTNSITHEEIAARARTMWEECGRPDGCDLEHWLRAEQELQHERENAEMIRQGLPNSRPKRAGTEKYGSIWPGVT